MLLKLLKGGNYSRAETIWGNIVSTTLTTDKKSILTLFSYLPCIFYKFWSSQSFFCTKNQSNSRTFIFIIFWILKVLYFLKICPIFVGSVDKRYEKSLSHFEGHFLLPDIFKYIFFKSNIFSIWERTCGFLIKFCLYFIVSAQY